jgi:hypothetical protein
MTTLYKNVQYLCINVKKYFKIVLTKNSIVYILSVRHTVLYVTVLDNLFKGTVYSTYWRCAALLER